MTEKRFKIADYPTDIEDTQTGEKYPCSSYYTHMEIICDLLNELNNENEQLKSENIDLRKDLGEFEKSINIQGLIGENEQLKQNIEVILKYCREKGKYAMDMKEIKAHNVLQRIVNDWKGDVE